MALVHWDPTRELSLLQGDMNRLFERFMGEPQAAGDRPRRWVPAMDVVEGDDHFLLVADLPGMTEDDVAIEVLDDTLRISGERRREHRIERAGFTRIERSFGTFERTLGLPAGIDAEAIEATFEDGVLELRIPKPVAATPRRVQIGARQRERELAPA